MFTIEIMLNKLVTSKISQKSYALIHFVESSCIHPGKNFGPIAHMLARQQLYTYC